MKCRGNSFSIPRGCAAFQPQQFVQTAIPFPFNPGLIILADAEADGYALGKPFLTELTCNAVIALSSLVLPPGVFIDASWSAFIAVAGPGPFVQAYCKSIVDEKFHG